MQKEKEEQLQRVNAICRHSLWQTSRKRIEELEQDRVFCRHDVIHFLDVARLAWIENLEQQLGWKRSMFMRQHFFMISGGICNMSRGFRMRREA